MLPVLSPMRIESRALNSCGCRGGRSHPAPCDHALSKPVKAQYNTNYELVLVACNRDITFQNKSMKINELYNYCRLCCSQSGIYLVLLSRWGAYRTGDQTI